MKFRSLVLSSWLTTLAASLVAAAAHAAPVERYLDPTLPEGLPFSSAVIVGETIYVAGHIGFDPETGTVVEGGVGPQTARTIENIQATLNAVGADLSDLVACTVFLTDIDDFAEMNAAYAPMFPDGFPARSAIGVNELVFDAKVEIECVAHRSAPAGDE